MLRPIIVAADVCTKSNDVEQLTDRQQVIDNTGFRPEVSDAGYYSEDNLTFLEQQGVEASSRIKLSTVNGELRRPCEVEYQKMQPAST